MGSLRSSSDPSCTSAAFHDPDRNGVSSPLRHERYLAFGGFPHLRTTRTAVAVPGRNSIRPSIPPEVSPFAIGSPCRDLHMRSCRPNSRSTISTMTETIPTRPFDDGEAIV